MLARGKRLQKTNMSCIGRLLDCGYGITQAKACGYRDNPLTPFIKGEFLVAAGFSQR